MLEMVDTLPTFTPAIRTSELGRKSLELGTMAWIVKWLANGLANLVKPPYTNSARTTIPVTPAASLLIGFLRLRLRGRILMGSWG